MYLFRKFFLLAVVSLTLSLAATSCDSNDEPSPDPVVCPTGDCDTIRLHLMTKEECATFLSTSDEHTRSLSKFSLQAYTGQSDATEASYLAFSKDQAREWSDEAVATIERYVRELNDTIRQLGLKLKFPAQINVAVSTCAEEGICGGYTRGTTVVLLDELFDTYTEFGRTLFAHELFHILTRHNADFRSEAYKLIDFTVMPKSVAVPEEFKDLVIENPDVNAHDSYSTFTIGGEKHNCIMLLTATKPYEGGSFFSYLRIGLLEIDPTTQQPLTVDGKCVYYDVSQATDFFSKVGCNTDYFIDPDEVLADNFSFIVSTRTDTLPTQSLLSDMLTLMRK